MIEGWHYQNAYVTRDIDKAVERATAGADVRSAVQFEATTEVLTALGRRPQTSKLAFIWIGDLQYEFIEPVTEAVPVFSSMLPEDGGLVRFHHSCARVPDWAEFRRRVDDQPLPVVIEGEGDQLRFLYLDARELLGHYLEYTWMSDAAWQRLGGR
jgi:hypothetical protein